MATVLLIASIAGAATLDEIEKKLNAKSKDIHTYTGKAKMTMTVEIPTNDPVDMTTKISFYCKQQADKFLYRNNEETDAFVLFQNQKINYKHTKLTIFDGQHAYVVEKNDGKGKAIKKDDSLFLFTINPVSKLRQQGTCKVAPDRKLHKFKCYVVAVQLKQDIDILGMKKLVYYFDKNSGIPVRIDGYKADGKKALHVAVSKLTLNPDIPESRFEFKKPKGVKLEDQTSKKKKKNSSKAK